MPDRGYIVHARHVDPLRAFCVIGCRCAAGVLDGMGKGGGEVCAWMIIMAYNLVDG